MIEYICLGYVRKFLIYFSETTTRATERFPEPQHPITDTSVANIIIENLAPSLGNATSLFYFQTKPNFITIQASAWFVNKSCFATKTKICVFEF